MLALIGESACGKSTIQNTLCDNYGFKKIITYTTRPKRTGEIDGVDYNFITQEDYDEKLRNNFFFENATYNGWNYGTARKDVEGNTDNKVIVLTPSGLRKFKSNRKIDLFSVYIKVDRKSRLVKILNRGDNIEEAYRRNLSDVGMFDGIENEVDWSIDNNKYFLDADTLAKGVKYQYLYCNTLNCQLRRLRMNYNKFIYNVINYLNDKLGYV